MRWMGDTRFVVGYLRGSQYILLEEENVFGSIVSVSVVIATKPCPVDLKIKVVSSSKSEMLETLKSNKPSASIVENVSSVGIPEDKYAKESTDSEGWIGFDKPILYI